MTNEESQKLGFREWTVHYEKEQEADREKINQITNIIGTLGSQVSKLSANMETLIDNQKGMFSRINRPWQWGVVVSIFMGLFAMSAMFATMATLIVGPIHNNLKQLEIIHSRDVERNLDLHIWFRETLANMQVSDAKEAANIAWLMKMEERLNNRLHSGIGQ